MKKFLGIFFCLFLVFGVTGMANATAVEYDDFLDFDSHGTDYIKLDGAFSYNHEIDFTPDALAVYTAVATIEYYGDGDSWFLSYGTQEFALTGSGLDYFPLVLDPALLIPAVDPIAEPFVLNFTLMGDDTLKFDSSMVSGEYEPVATPEPASMLLLGSGMIGLAGIGRKRFRRKL